MIDLKRNYAMPMYVAGTAETEERIVPVKCSYVYNHIVAQAEGYDKKFFCEEFFQWMLYRGYITDITGEHLGEQTGISGNEV